MGGIPFVGLLGVLFAESYRWLRGSTVGGTLGVLGPGGGIFHSGLGWSGLGVTLSPRPPSS